MATTEKIILKRSHEERKVFSYEKGATRLSFNLRVDIKQELKDFAEILSAAHKDVLDTLEEMR